MIDKFFPVIETQLVALQSSPNLRIVSVTAADISAMHQHVRQFYLRPRDTFHLSVMQRMGCTNLVSEDSDFDTVTDLNVLPSARTFSFASYDKALKVWNLPQFAASAVPAIMLTLAGIANWGWLLCRMGYDCGGGCEWECLLFADFG